MKIRLAGAELFHAYVRTEGQIDTKSPFQDIITESDCIMYV
jgi:hypothetical protein